MDDSISLTDEQYDSICRQAIQKWTHTQDQIIGEPGFPDYAFRVSTLCEGHPTMPRTLHLENNSEGVFATGDTIWSSGSDYCSYHLPTFRQPIQIKVATLTPTSLTFSHIHTNKVVDTSQFEEDENYLPILMLAWSYILSARWAETIPEHCSMSYTAAQPASITSSNGRENDQNNAHLYLGCVDVSEARWWAAVLAQGQGWKARMSCQHKIFMSPWSVEFRAECGFVIQCADAAIYSSHPAASSFEAIDYLDKFCTARNIIDQSHAALAAVILLPAMGNGRTLNLPGSGFAKLDLSRSARTATRRPRHDVRHDWISRNCNLDRILTLSCNVKGVRPLLLSAFYEPSIQCNAVAPWLQGTWAAIDHLARSDPHITVRLCMEQAPAAAFLWLGIFALGLHQRLIQEARFGQMPIDLNSAAWAGNIQSFIQERVSVPPVTRGLVSRADECRLLFLTQSSSHARLPLCQWHPFGTTPLDDADIDVRIHQACGDHELRYEGVSWRCEDSKEMFQPSSGRINASSLKRKSQNLACEDTYSESVCTRSFQREREAISENATRNIFGWLRCDGHAPNEDYIWRHEWFDVSDSDDGELSEGEGESTNSNLLGSSTRVASWLPGVATEAEGFGNDLAAGSEGDKAC